MQFHPAVIYGRSDIISPISNKLSVKVVWHVTFIKTSGWEPWCFGPSHKTIQTERQLMAKPSDSTVTKATKGAKGAPKIRRGRLLQ